MMEWLLGGNVVVKTCLALITIYVVRYLLTARRKSSPLANRIDRNKCNPLAADSRTAIAPLQTNGEERQKILKKAFSKEVAGENWDVVVIGSGIGGLSAAALLSKVGLKVLVLEKHGKGGGACHIFKSEGYEFDVGIHYLGEFTRQTLTKTLVDQISAGQIQWGQLDSNFDRVILKAHSPNQKEYDVPSGKGKWKQQLKEQFPEESEAIEKFFEMVNKVNKHTWTLVLVKVLPLWLVNLADRIGLLNWFSDFFKIGSKSVKQVLEELTSNQELQLLLSYCWGTYASPPSEAGFALHSMLIKHYELGASYPMGGASEIPYQVIQEIERNGGKVLMKAPVQQILTDESSRVVGVRVGKSSDTCEIRAPVVISDAGIHNTFLKLLPEEVARNSQCYELALSMNPGVGCLSIFIGLRGTTEELGLKAQNVWAFMDEDPEKTFYTFNAMELEDVLDRPYPVIFIGFPSAKDPSWNQRYQGRSTITVVTFAPYRWFEKWNAQKVKKRDEDYQAVKQNLGQQIVDQVCQLYPELKNAVDHVVVGTPVTNQHYLSAHEGAIYGLDHPKERFMPHIAAKLRPETNIEGLYLTGQDIMSAGFASALYGGLMCASSVLERNLYQDLIALHKKLGKK